MYLSIKATRCFISHTNCTWKHNSQRRHRHTLKKLQTPSISICHHSLRCATTWSRTSQTATTSSTRLTNNCWLSATSSTKSLSTTGSYDLYSLICTLSITTLRRLKNLRHHLVFTNFTPSLNPLFPSKTTSHCRLNYV